MAKILTAQSYAIETVDPKFDATNALTGYVVTYNVLYSDGTNEVHVREVEDLWLVASDSHKNSAQTIQDAIKTRLDNVVL